MDERKKQVVTEGIERGLHLAAPIIEALVRAGIDVKDPATSIGMSVAIVSLMSAHGVDKAAISGGFNAVNEFCHHGWEATKDDQEIQDRADRMAKERMARLRPYLKSTEVKH